MESTEQGYHRKPRRREQLLNNVRQFIKPISENSGDLIAQMIRIHIPQARFTMVIRTEFEDTEEICACLVDGKYIITMKLPYHPDQVINTNLACLGVPRNPDLTAADVRVSLEDAGEYFRREGRHNQWLWAAVLEMRLLVKSGVSLHDDRE